MTQLNFPAEIIAGDTLSFEPSTDYDSTTDILTFVLTKEGKHIAFNASDNSGSYLVTVLPSITKDWYPGDYHYSAFVTVGTDRYTIGGGSVLLKPDLATLTAGYDGRSHVQKVVDALRSTMEKKATRDQSAMMVEGQSISRMTPDDILMWLGKYEHKLRAEKQQEAVDNGQANGSKILVRF